MSRSNFDTFAFVMNFINSKWVPYHAIVRLFEAFDTFGIALVKQMKI
jgi:hypothetical protein